MKRTVLQKTGLFRARRAPKNTPSAAGVDGAEVALEHVPMANDAAAAVEPVEEPDRLCCPISRELFRDPVVCSPPRDRRTIFNR